MAISKKEIDEIHTYGAQDYNNYIMKLKNHYDLEKILMYMLKIAGRERVRRTYSRYCVARRQFETKMINKRTWYKLNDNTSKIPKNTILLQKRYEQAK